MRYLIAILLVLMCSVAWARTVTVGQAPVVAGGPEITYVSTGTVAGGATPAAITPGIPSSIQAGDLLVLAVENKYPTNSPSTPTGWTLSSNCQGSGGASTAAADSGTVYSTVFWKKAIGNESGTQTVTITSANSSRGAIVAYRPTSGYEITPVCTNGAYSHGSTTSWSATGADDPGFAAGDWAVVASANNSDLAASFSSQAMTATGYTFGSMTERVDSVESQGNDSSLVVADFASGTGTSSDVPTYTMTGATNGTNTPAGSSVIVRLRPVADTTAPTISAALPSANVSCPEDPTAVTIGVTTDEAANCKWDTSDTTYELMANTYSTGQGASVHTTSIGNLACEATATRYTRCADTLGNANSSSTTHSITMAALSTGNSDSFTGTDDTLLATHDSNWVNANSTYTVAGFELYSNTVRPVGSYDTAGARYNISTSDISQAVYKGGRSGDQTTSYAAVRMNGTSLGYSCIFSGASGGNWTIVDVQKDGNWVAQAITGGTWAQSADHTMRVRASGTGGTVTVYCSVDGGSEGSYADSTAPYTTGLPGLVGYADGTMINATFDDWTDE